MTKHCNELTMALQGGFFFFNFVFMKDSESMYKKSWKFIMFE